MKNLGGEVSGLVQPVRDEPSAEDRTREFYRARFGRVLTDEEVRMIHCNLGDYFGVLKGIWDRRGDGPVPVEAKALQGESI